MAGVRHNKENSKREGVINKIREKKFRGENLHRYFHILVRQKGRGGGDGFIEGNGDDGRFEKNGSFRNHVNSKK